MEPPSRIGRRVVQRPRGYLALALAVELILGLAACDRRRGPEIPDYVELDVGLGSAERDEIRFLSEGSDLVPVDLLLALANPATGELFIDSMDDYGFIPSRPSPRNPLGLPIGWTTDTPELSPNRLPYVGINCAACHTGRIDYGGRSLLIDGAPNMADIEGLGLAVRDAVVATLDDPVESVALVSRLAELRHPEDGAAALLNVPKDARKFLANLRKSVRGGSGDDEMASALQTLLKGGSKEEVLRGLGQGKTAKVGEVVDILARYVPVVRARADFGLRALGAIERSPRAGPGRDDPWGLVRNVLFQTETRLTAPTSIPALFHIADFDWYHADGNTTSILERDITQAVSLGAYVDPENGESTLLAANIHRLESLWDRVRSPAWPEEFLEPIDRELAARGQEIFTRRVSGAMSCADCHGAWRATLLPFDEVGTDPNRALNFARPLDGGAFAERIPAAVRPILETALTRVDSGLADVLRAQADAALWRTTGSYLARRLDGIWATAPYLHNGSVPTLHDLLLPAGERPRVFHLGHRDYDARRVGYLPRVEEPIFIFDTAIEGNGNGGHEYGVGLTESDRWALVEYLKTL